MEIRRLFSDKVCWPLVRGCKHQHLYNVETVNLHTHSHTHTVWIFSKLRSIKPLNEAQCFWCPWSFSTDAGFTAVETLDSAATFYTVTSKLTKEQKRRVLSFPAKHWNQSMFGFNTAGLNQGLPSA